MALIDKTEVMVRPAVPEDHDAICNVYLASRKDALPTVKIVWGDQSVRDWIGSLFKSKGQMFVAEIENKIIGFLRIVGQDLDQLYLMPGYYRKGIGTMLLNKAKDISPDGLTLFTFQVNERARAFYESHGFRAVETSNGQRNEEMEPDILYEWRPGTN
ncbi:hypothetical protein V2A60_007163 [Cordyceps javanica]|uniref:Acetyltransferase (GNAT)domain-containing protein n=1 Tax=Cordyceps javanica TaxID=43265 RepID=A0A545USM4_9HYPO|nr:acetyltransferase (GNAT)domain-containing protein [Cordyceps javanica]TQW04286.1 acetyltransferase (GNAT) domain-containing protein [Cordyceps javanica]